MSISSSTPVSQNVWTMNPNHNQPNRKFKNEYIMKEELGKGGFGTVRRCVDKREKREYAAKMNKTPDGKRSMIDEAQISLALSNPIGHINIVNLYDTITEGDIVYNIYELATGGDIMEDIVKREFYSVRDASIAIEQILKGVQWINDKGYIHRDLKPQNLLLQSKRSKVIKVTDFGLAIERVKGQSGAYIAVKHGKAGTPSHISPEVHDGLEYDVDADLWSCGVILYQLIAGYLPFWDDDQNVVLNNIRNVTYDFPSPEWDGLDDAQQLIEMMLAKIAQRSTIQDCLNHSFIINRTQDPTFVEPRKQTLNAMTNFLARRQLKLSILQMQWGANTGGGSASGAQLHPQPQFQLQP